MYQSTLTKDVYKEFHVTAGHPDILGTYENFTNRSGKYSNVEGNDGVVNVGWQYFIKKHLIERWDVTFFGVDKDAACKRHQIVMSSILGYQVDVGYLESLHDLGYLPLRIKSLPEGTIVPYQVASATFESTCGGFGWLPGMIETVVSQEVWPIQTAATTALAYLRKQREYFEKTGADLDMLKFMIHDFSSRGCFGEEADAMSGFGHLAVGNCGSDSIVAGLFAEKYYGADWSKELVMASVNATEHSVTCGWMEEGEEVYFRHLMNVVAPQGILSVVSDTWDFWNTVTVIAANLKDDIMKRDGKVVFRPDSGDPVKILTGYKTFDCGDNGDYDLDDLWNSGFEALTFNGVTREIELYQSFGENAARLGSTLQQCEVKGLVEVLWDTFGGTHTREGYKMLDEHVGAIYGDAITLERQEQIGERLMAKSFVPQVVLGVGSYSYQYVTRDTHGSAMKATNVYKGKLEEGSTWRYNFTDVSIFKDPKTDSKKKSAKGLLRVERVDGKLVQYDEQTRDQEKEGLLQVIFEDGVLYNEQSLADIRAVVATQL